MINNRGKTIFKKLLWFLLTSVEVYMMSTGQQPIRKILAGML
jgi:hypothetical protein